MIRQTWKCRYCPCLSYTSKLAVIHELHECSKNPRNLIKTESYFMEKDKNYLLQQRNPLKEIKNI